MLCKNSFGMYIGNGAGYKLVSVCLCVFLLCDELISWQPYRPRKSEYIFILWLHWVLLLSLLSSWNALFSQWIIHFSLFGWTTLASQNWLSSCLKTICFRNICFPLKPCAIMVYTVIVEKQLITGCCGWDSFTCRVVPWVFSSLI